MPTKCIWIDMTEFINDFYLLCGLIAVMYVWYDTDAFVEWAKKFRLNFLKYKDYYAFKEGPFGRVVKTYNEFLLYKYGKSFFFRLITCELCSSVWLNLIALSVFTDSIGGIKVLGFNVIVTWVGYFALRYILKVLA